MKTLTLWLNNSWMIWLRKTWQTLRKSLLELRTTINKFLELLVGKRRCGPLTPGKKINLLQLVTTDLITKLKTSKILTSISKRMVFPSSYTNLGPSLEQVRSKYVTIILNTTSSTEKTVLKLDVLEASWSPAKWEDRLYRPQDKKPWALIAKQL